MMPVPEVVVMASDNRDSQGEDRGRRVAQFWE